MTIFGALPPISHWKNMLVELDSDQFFPNFGGKEITEYSKPPPGYEVVLNKESLQKACIARRAVSVSCLRPSDLYKPITFFRYVCVCMSQLFIKSAAKKKKTWGNFQVSPWTKSFLAIWQILRYWCARQGCIYSLQVIYKFRRRSPSWFISSLHVLQS